MGTSASTAHRRWYGSVLPFVIVVFPVFVGMVTFAVDVGYVSLVKTELRTAVDAATLAGASGLLVSPEEARKRAKEIALSNYANGKPVVLQDSDIQLGTWNATTGQFTTMSSGDESKATAIYITGTLSRSRGNAVNLLFAPILGQKAGDVSASAIAGFGQGADVVIVQDITSSFSDELADAKVGDQALIDSLYADGAGRSFVGLVAHTGWGKTISNLKSIKTNYTAISQAVSDLKLCGNVGMPACSGTDIASGLEEALKVFDDPSYTFAGTAKAIVLVSDGEPTSNSSGSHPALNATQLLTLAQQRADEAWAQQIHVYVVFFNRENDPAAAAKVGTLPRGKGDFVQVTDAKQLPVALAEITKKLPMQLVR